MRVRQESGQVAGEEHLALAVADNDAAGIAHPRRDDGVRLTRGHDEQGMGAVELRNRAPDGFDERQPFRQL